jgi:hypothetical protein
VVVSLVVTMNAAATATTTTASASASTNDPSGAGAASAAASAAPSAANFSAMHGFTVRFKCLSHAVVRCSAVHPIHVGTVCLC